MQNQTSAFDSDRSKLTGNLPAGQSDASQLARFQMDLLNLNLRLSESEATQPRDLPAFNAAIDEMKVLVRASRPVRD